MIDPKDFHTGHPDPRLLELPGSPPAYDPKAKTLFDKKCLFESFDVSALEHYDVRAAIVSGMLTVERSGDEVDGFAQVGLQIIVCGKGGAGHTAMLAVCWECHWLSKAHRPDCSWKAVRDVNEL